MKMFFLFLTLASYAFQPVTQPPIDAVILKQFKNAFPLQDGAVWYLAGANWEVKFSNQDIQNRITYNNKGEIIASYRYYKEANFDPFIKAKVQEKFENKKIFGITEITSENQKTYLIIMEDETHWYHVKALDGNYIWITKKYKKA